MTEGKGQRGLERDSDVKRESCETDSEARRSPSVSFGAQAAGLVRTSVGVSVRSIELVGRARGVCGLAQRPTATRPAQAAAPGPAARSNLDRHVSRVILISLDADLSAQHGS